MNEKSECFNNLELDSRLSIIYEEIEKSKDFITDRQKLSKSLKPYVPLGGPYGVSLLKDRVYFYCTCGYSKYQPFCDGESHEGTGFQPLKLTMSIDCKKSYLCGCKHNKPSSGAYCDGSHINCEW